MAKSEEPEQTPAEKDAAQTRGSEGSKNAAQPESAPEAVVQRSKPDNPAQTELPAQTVKAAKQARHAKAAKPAQGEKAAKATKATKAAKEGMPGKDQQGEEREKTRLRDASWLTGMISAFEESWDEIRVNRVRILTGLFGIVVSVAALATVVGLGSMASQIFRESQEQWGGRPATLQLMVYNSGQGSQVGAEELHEKVLELDERYKLKYIVRQSNGSVRLQLPDGVIWAQVNAFDRDFGLTRKVSLIEGNWFTERDERRLAPAVIINEKLWDRMGRPDLSTNPTLQLMDDNQGLAVIVGVTPSTEWESEVITMLYDDFQQPVSMWGPNLPSYQFWVGTEIAEQLRNQILQEVKGAFGDGVEVHVERTDYEAMMMGEDPYAAFTLILGSVAVVVLLLGSLGVLNIAMVTIRQRVREIGIRRSFGATSRRVFFSVMMESVVATTLAGFLGVIISILLLRNEFMIDWLVGGFPIAQLPPYPVEAAVIGFIASIVVGALSGLLPALYAVNSKVIEAIRY